MAKLVSLVCATIVGFSYFSAYASPDTYAPAPANPPKPPNQDSAATLENLSVATPPPTNGPAEPEPARYYHYRHAVTLRGGMITDLNPVEFDEGVFGAQYMFPKFLSPKLEVGVDVREDGRGHVYGGWRWIFLEKSYFRPSFKLSLDHKFVSEDGFATLSEIDNWNLRQTGTIEFVVWNPYSLRIEAEIFFNFAKTQGMASLGVSRGF